MFLEWFAPGETTYETLHEFHCRVRDIGNFAIKHPGRSFLERQRQSGWQWYMGRQHHAKLADDE
jgi:hypothetical protein